MDDSQTKTPILKTATDNNGKVTGKVIAVNKGATCSSCFQALKDGATGYFCEVSSSVFCYNCRLKCKNTMWKEHIDYCATIEVNEK